MHTNIYLLEICHNFYLLENENQILYGILVLLQAILVIINGVVNLVLSHITLFFFLIQKIHF